MSSLFLDLSSLPGTVCRAFWAYYDKFPSQGRRLLDSVDPQMQKHLNDEKMAMQKPG